jgi:hypothetical protein
VRYLRDESGGHSQDVLAQIGEYRGRTDSAVGPVVDRVPQARRFLRGCFGVQLLGQLANDAQVAAENVTIVTVMKGVPSPSTSPGITKAVTTRSKV